MEAVVSIMSIIVPSAITLIGCLINNNVQRTKEQHAIEMQIAEINANYDKQTAIIKEQINTLSDHVKEHNNLIDRMYKVEELTTHLDYMIRELREDDRR